MFDFLKRNRRDQPDVAEIEKLRTLYFKYGKQLAVTPNQLHALMHAGDVLYYQKSPTARDIEVAISIVNLAFEKSID